MAKPSAKVHRAWVVQYESVFLYTLIAIVRNDESAKDFAEFRTPAQDLTEDQLGTVARYASEHFVSKAYPNPGKLAEEEIADLMKEAIGEALKKRANEERP
jgi:hypothetical protein